MFDVNEIKLIRLNSIFTVCLAIIFLLFFQFIKHDPLLSAIIPFANDPYDAVGSLGVIIAGLLAVLSVIRAFSRAHAERQRILVARTQFTVGAAIFVTLGVYSVAMIKHVPMWFDHPGSAELLALMFSMFASALLMSFVIRYSVRDIHLEASSWKKVTIISIMAITVLVLYPEYIIRSIAGELFTLFVGIFILFIILAAISEAFIPYNIESFNSSETRPHHMRTRIELGVVAIIGIIIGIALLLGESKGGGVPINVVIIFIGVPLLSLLFAYYLLRRPLALFHY